MASGDTSDSVTVSSYTAANSILLFSQRGGGTQGQNSTVRGIKLNSTTLQFNVDSTGTSFEGEWYLLEFDTDADVQDMTASGPGNQAISSVTLAQSFLVPLGVEIPLGTGFGAWENFRLSFVSSTLTNVDKGGAGTTGYQVVDLVGASVQEITTASITTGNQNNESITAVTLAETIHFATFSTDDNALEFDNQYRSSLSSTTNWLLQRTEGGTQPEQTVTAHIVELPVGEWSVNRDTGSMSNVTISDNINTVVSDLSKAFPRTTAANGSPAINATDGGNTNYNQAMATAKQTAVANLLLQRTTSGSQLNYAWEVAEFVGGVIGQIKLNAATVANGSQPSPPSLTSQLGDNRIGIVLTSEEETNNPSAMTLGGEAMTKLADAVNISGIGNTTTMWGILDADMPAGAGPHAVVPTGLGTGAAITVYEIENAAQVLPLEGGSAVDIDQTAVSVTSISTAPSGPAGNFIACAINCHGGDGNPWNDPPSGDGVWIRTFNNPATSALSVGAHQVFLSDPGGTVTLTENVSGGPFNRGSACNAVFAEFQEVETGDIDNAITEPAEVAIAADAVSGGVPALATEPSEVAIAADAVSGGVPTLTPEPVEVAIASSSLVDGVLAAATEPSDVAIAGSSLVDGALAAEGAPAEVAIDADAITTGDIATATEPAEVSILGGPIAGTIPGPQTEPPEVALAASVLAEGSPGVVTEPAEAAIAGGPIVGGSVGAVAEPAETSISGGPIAGSVPILEPEPAEASFDAQVGVIPAEVLVDTEPAKVAIGASVTLPMGQALLATEPAEAAFVSTSTLGNNFFEAEAAPAEVSIQAAVPITATLAAVAPPAQAAIAAENIGIVAPVLELHSEAIHSLDL